MSHLYTKSIFLPRQALDKHRKSTLREKAFSPEYLVESGLLERCPFKMPSAAIARELAKVAGVSELAIQGSMMAGAGLDLPSFTEMILSTAEKSGALPSDSRPDPRSDDPGKLLPEEQIGTSEWNGARQNLLLTPFLVGMFTRLV